MSQNINITLIFSKIRKNKKEDF